MKIEELSLDKIKPYEKNPRKNDGAVNGVAESIKQFGFQQPIVIDAKGVIIAGHTRYKAAKKLGLKTVPCVRADQLTKEQVKAYRILDNKLNELAVWNFETLAEELKSFQFDFSGFDVQMPDFSTDFFDYGSKQEDAEPQTAEQLDDETSDVPAASSADSQQSGEWEGMPAYQSENKGVPHIVVNFRTMEEKLAFSEVVGQKITETTSYIYYPKQERENLTGEVWQ